MHRGRVLFMPALALVGSLVALPLTNAGASRGLEVASAPVEDAEAFADYFDVPLEQAGEQLQLQALAGKLNAALRSSEGETFAGVEVNHRNGFDAAVYTTSLEDAPYAGTVARLGLQDHVNFVQVPLPLNALTQKAREIASSSVANHWDVWVNIPRNAVVLAVPEASLERADHLAHSSRVLVKVRTGNGQPTAFAGQSMTTCTAGFTVRQQDGDEGITTAGHCDQDQAMSGTDLNYVSQEYGGHYDFQWHKKASLNFQNYAYDGQNDSSTPYYREITARKPRSEQNVGDFVCKYGKTTYFGCGEINTTDMCPSWIPNAECTFVRAIHKDGDDLSSDGDSGGPVYSGGTALGLISGEWGYFGNQNMVVYMPQNYLNERNLHVKIN